MTGNSYVLPALYSYACDRWWLHATIAWVQRLMQKAKAYSRKKRLVFKISENKENEQGTRFFIYSLCTMYNVQQSVKKYREVIVWRQRSLFFTQNACLSIFWNEGLHTLTHNLLKTIESLFTLTQIKDLDFPFLQILSIHQKFDELIFFLNPPQT